MQPRIIANYRCQVGENPLWHPMENKLYWTDIVTGRLFRYDPSTGDHEQCHAGNRIGGFTIQENGALLFFMEKGAVRIWDHGTTRTVLDGLPGEQDNRFNDVIADPEGRVYCGTMSTDRHAGRLYRLETDGGITMLMDGIGTSNGLGFTRDLKTLYYTDTAARTIYQFDYDRATGAISRRRNFAVVDASEQAGVPDGLTVDAEDHVWSARWGGRRLVRYNGDGVAQTTILFAAANVSSLTFGGKDYKDIYVTSATAGIAPEKQQDDGALFHLRSEVAGKPEFFSRVGI